LNCPIVHFELPADNPEKLKEFYEGVFGWKFKKSEIPGFNYWSIETKKDETGGGINGGMSIRKGNEGITNYVMVESIEEYIKKAESHGGKLLMPKQEIPGIGFNAIVQDPDGNPLGLFQPVQ